eukprot:GHVU01161587.1.p1 GENE.GHVU01161587.1~~GHVU01161587.1.p1  ORF type:complete len:114 (+),score=9.45 GHVU01161587.1:158-499(+)
MAPPTSPPLPTSQRVRAWPHGCAGSRTPADEGIPAPQRTLQLIQERNQTFTTGSLTDIHMGQRRNEGDRDRNRVETERRGTGDTGSRSEFTHSARSEAGCAGVTIEHSFKDYR